MNLRHEAGQYVLVDEQEVGIFPFFDATMLILDEHLLGYIDGQGGKRLLAGQDLQATRAPALSPT